VRENDERVISHSRSSVLLPRQLVREHVLKLTTIEMKCPSNFGATLTSARLPGGGGIFVAILFVNSQKRQGGRRVMIAHCNAANPPNQRFKANLFSAELVDWMMQDQSYPHLLQAVADLQVETTVSTKNDMASDKDTLAQKGHFA
jgi:hypothetical protein